MATADLQQALWNAEAGDEFDRLITRLTAEKRKKHKALAAADKAFRRRLAEAKKADAELDRAVCREGRAHGLEFVRECRALARAAEEAQAAADRARQERQLAKAAWERARDELRVTRRRWLEPLPLFDRVEEKANGDCTPPGPPRQVVGGREGPWPGGLTEGQLRAAYLPERLARAKDRARPVKAEPFAWGGRLWVYVGEDGRKVSLLPLLPAAEFAARWPEFPRRHGPGPLARGEGEAWVEAPAGTACGDGKMEWWSGVVVKVGRQEYAVCPAAEKRVITRPEV